MCKFVSEIQALKLYVYYDDWQNLHAKIRGEVEIRHNINDTLIHLGNERLLIEAWGGLKISGNK